MTSSGASFSVATTVFVSLAICAIISYGMFYYFKQRLAVIEQSQMEQARIMQAIISRGLAQVHEHSKAPQEPPHTQLQQPVTQQAQQAQQAHHYDKEITITQSGLIEVSSDDESVSDSSASSSASSSTETDDEEEDKWSIGDEIHQPDSYHAEFDEKFKKNILLDAICIDGSYVVENISVPRDHENDEDNVSNKKIISLNKGAWGADDADVNATDDASDDESSSSSSDAEEVQDKDNANVHDLDSDLNLKIGYKHKKEPLHLNYGNMSVPALRQLAKERGLGGEDADLQKLKKKNLVQLLQ
jgi:hypothetical protein